MLYSVKYRKCGSFFWKTLKAVKADSHLVSEGLQVKVLILNDETRVEIPYNSHEFRYSRERYLTILKSMEKEAGQKMAVVDEQ